MATSTDCQAHVNIFEMVETALRFSESIKFYGEDNFFCLRVTHELLVRPLFREQIDSFITYSSIPNLTSKLPYLFMAKKTQQRREMSHSDIFPIIIPPLIKGAFATAIALGFSLTLGGV
jgi:hypothetical protein